MSIELLYVIGVLTCLCLVAIIIYGVVLFAFASKYHDGGFTWAESLERARSELT